MHFKHPNFHPDPHKSFRKTRDVAHTLYFAMAFLEGHSLYAYTAGGLFVMCCVAFFIHEEV